MVWFGCTASEQENVCRFVAGYFPGELHVGYVTNGVHYPTWTCPEIRSLLEHNVKDKTYQNNPVWKIFTIPPMKAWALPMLKEKLINYIRERLANPQIVKYESPRHVVEIQEKSAAMYLP